MICQPAALAAWAGAAAVSAAAAADTEPMTMPA